MSGGRWMSWLGIVSCTVAGVFICVGQAAGRRSRLLRDAKQVGSLAELSALKHLLPMVIAVTGRVYCSSPIKSEDGSTGAAILQASEEQHFMKQNEGGEWKHDKVTVFNSVREVPWSLDDGSGMLVEVLNGRSASSLNLITTFDEYLPLGKNFIQYAADHLRGIKMLGVRRTERVLPVGMALTVVGELSAGMPRSVTGPVNLVLKQPMGGEPFYITTKSLPELLESLSSLSRVCKYLATGFGAVGVYLLLSHAIVVIMKEMRRRKYRRRVHAERLKHQQGLLASGSQQGGDLDRDRPTNLCIVCLENSLDAVFVKCGHMCCCMNCAVRLQQCPVCRKNTHVIKVYIP